MKRAIPLLLSLFLCGCSYYPFGTMPRDYVQAASTNEFRLGGWLDTAGPYGDLWIILVNEDRAWVEVDTSKHKIHMTTQELSAIKKAVITSDFFSLPAEITEPYVPLHQPNFDLYVSMNGRYHEVNLYDPKALTDKESLRRFMIVWNAVTKSLDLKPEWQ